MEKRWASFVTPAPPKNREKKKEGKLMWRNRANANKCIAVADPMLSLSLPGDLWLFHTWISAVLCCGVFTRSSLYIYIHVCANFLKRKIYALPNIYISPLMVAAELDDQDHVCFLLNFTFFFSFKELENLFLQICYVFIFFLGFFFMYILYPFAFFLYLNS